MEAASTLFDFVDPQISSLLANSLFGDGAGYTFQHALARPFSWVERALWAPVVRPFFWLAAAFAFVPARRQALAFWVTRPVLTGTGTLSDDDRFGLISDGGRVSVAGNDPVANQTFIAASRSSCKARRSAVARAAARISIWPRLLKTHKQVAATRNHHTAPTIRSQLPEVTSHHRRHRRTNSTWTSSCEQPSASVAHSRTSTRQRRRRRMRNRRVHSRTRTRIYLRRIRQ